jgi:hypothetical protein
VLSPAAHEEHHTGEVPGAISGAFFLKLKRCFHHVKYQPDVFSD